MLNLQQQNEATALQRRMGDEGFCAEFANVFAQCLPRSINGASDQVDWNAVTVFESWALLHPNLKDALDFLKRVLADRMDEWQLHGLQARLSGRAK
jgi:hypothetical protein